METQKKMEERPSTLLPPFNHVKTKDVVRGNDKTEISTEDTI
jgi:hypothetical protein